MSERSERVGRPSDAPRTSGLASVVAAERATTTPPEDPPAPTASQRSQPRYEEVRVGPPAGDVGRRVLPRTTNVVGEPGRRRIGRGGSAVGGSAVLRC